MLQDLENAPERSRQPRHRWTAEMIHPLADQGEGKPASFVARDVLPRRGARRRAPAHLGARALPRLHQRQAGRRRPADPGLDLLRQAHRLPDLPGRRAAAAGREPDRDLARGRLVPLADHVAATRRSSIAGATGSARWPRSPRATRCCCGPTAHGRAARCRSCGRASTSARSTTPGSRVRRRPRASRCWSSTRACWWRRSAGRSASWRRSRSRESWTDRKGRTIYDFGQNAAGYVAFTVRGAAGARVLVEHSEIVDRDREIDNRNYRSAAARIEYVLKGDGVEAYRPHFTFQGFRYAAVTIEGDARARVDRVRADQLGERGDGELRVRQPAGEPARREHALVAAVELHRDPDRLPAARRAAGLDRRRPGVRARPPATCTTATPSCASTCAR